MIVSEVIDTLVGDVHVTAEQIADVNIGTYGSGDYVLSTGRKLEAELISNNTVRIFDGAMVYCGVRDVVAANNYHDVTIENGSQGMNRNDIIVRYFKKDEETLHGSAEFKAIKGTPTEGEASDPVIEVTDLRTGALEHSMLMYRVKLEGLNVISLEPMFDILYNAAELKQEIAELNSNIERFLGTASVTATSSLCVGYCDKTKNTCRIYFHLRSSGAIATNQILFTIPEGYRPSDNYAGIATIWTSEISFPYSVTISPDGKITQGATNSLIAIIGVIEYPI